MAETENQELILNTTLSDLCLDSLLNTRNFFGNLQGNNPLEFTDNIKIRLHSKINDEYKKVHNRKPVPLEESGKAQEKSAEPDYEKDIEAIATNIQNVQASKGKADAKKPLKQKEDFIIEDETIPQGPKTDIEKMIEELPKTQQDKLSKIPKKFLIFGKKEEEPGQQPSTALVPSTGGQVAVHEAPRMGTVALGKLKRLVRPTWHAPWKLMRVISGHQGWVRCIAVDHSNQFFATGSNDRTIKFWDLASGKLKLTLTGHISAVRGLALSSRHAYLYSCSEDKTVKCWDLETNKVVRSYHGHLSGVYCMALHPKLDILATGGRDSVVRLWDCRTKAQIHVLEGHTNVISSIISQEYEPQFVSGSHDHMIRLWDVGSGRAIETLTNHKKSVRAMSFHPNEYTFASGASDNLKVWKCPEGEFIRNVSGHNAIINDMAISQDNVMVSCADDGSMYFWDWKSGYNFQQIYSKPQPGSISSEAGVYCAEFDRSSLRLITGECDKTIKIWKEDEEATEETHPVDLNWRPSFR